MDRLTTPNMAVLQFRHLAKKAIRSMFDDQGFIELDTPYLLKANAPDPYIDPIHATSYSGKAIGQLHTSPEIWLKRGLALGFKKIYHMARVFRDDPPGKHHSREFTMLEWYRVGFSLEDLLRDCEDIFRVTYEKASEMNLFAKSETISFIKTDLDVLFREFAKIDLSAVLHAIAGGESDQLQQAMAKKNDYLPKNATFLDTFSHVMLKYIEPNLPKDKPVAIFRWPIELAALAAPCQDNPNYCDRFEIYFKGLEIANAYQECMNPQILKERFSKENQERTRLGKPFFIIDEAFFKDIALIPKTAGIALGIDRLFQAVLNKEEIKEVIFGFSDH